LVDIEVIDRHSELSKIISECYKSSIEVPTFGAEYLIEIKPVVSDDFPAVLRQMKLSKAKILFISKYTGIGATKEEFVNYFKTQGIRVVFQSDVDNFSFENEQFHIMP
jgi:hypothetical protein